jgi:hypothetical protein
MAGNGNMAVVATWDTAQLTADEMSSCLDCMVGLMQVLSRVSWEVEVGNVIRDFVKE